MLYNYVIDANLSFVHAINLSDNLIVISCKVAISNPDEANAYMAYEDASEIARADQSNVLRIKPVQKYLIVSPITDSSCYDLIAPLHRISLVWQYYTAIHEYYVTQSIFHPSPAERHVVTETLPLQIAIKLLKCLMAKAKQ